MNSYSNTQYCDSPCQFEGWTNPAPVQPYAGGYPPTMPTYGNGFSHGGEHGNATKFFVGGTLVGAILTYLIMKR